jgi:hypothetical protein
MGVDIAFSEAPIATRYDPVGTVFVNVVIASIAPHQFFERASSMPLSEGVSGYHLLPKNTF